MLYLEQLLTESFGKVDPTLVQIFINKSTQISNGTLVKLSDNRWVRSFSPIAHILQDHG